MLDGREVCCMLSLYNSYQKSYTIITLALFFTKVVAETPPPSQTMLISTVSNIPRERTMHLIKAQTVLE